MSEIDLSMIFNFPKDKENKTVEFMLRYLTFDSFDSTRARRPPSICVSADVASALNFLQLLPLIC